MAWPGLPALRHDCRPAAHPHGGRSEKCAGDGPGTAFCAGEAGLRRHLGAREGVCCHQGSRDALGGAREGERPEASRMEGEPGGSPQFGVPSWRWWGASLGSVGAPRSQAGARSSSVVRCS